MFWLGYTMVVVGLSMIHPGLTLVLGGIVVLGYTFIYWLDAPKENKDA